MTTTTWPLPVEVGAHINALRYMRRLKQADLADSIGVTTSTMSKKLRGETPITVEELYALARALGTDPRDLLPRLDSNQQPSGWTFPEVSEIDDLVHILAA